VERSKRRKAEKLKSLNEKLVLLFLFLPAIILRVFYLITPQIDSDFAVMGLMARHIVKGEFPLFFYGGYFEAPIESYIAAPLFWFFGSSRLVLDCVPAFMSLITIYAVYKLAQTLYGNSIAKLTLLFSSIAPAFFVSRTTIPLEGYIETTCLGALAFMLTYKIIYLPREINLRRYYFLLGLIIGFSFYLQFHIVPFAITIGIFLLLNNPKIFTRKEFLFLSAGFLLGNLPLILFNITHNFLTFAIVGSGIQNSTFFGTLGHLIVYGYMVLLGIRIDGSDTQYAPYLSPLLIAIYMACFLYFFLKRQRGSGILITFLMVFAVTYYISGKGETNTRRYLLPLYSVVPIIIARGIDALRNRSRIIFYSAVIFIAGYNLYTNITTIAFFNPEARKYYHAEISHEKALGDFLKSKGIRGAYSHSWWTSLQLNFDLKEEVIFNLLCGEPYLPYEKIVDSQPNPAFVSFYGDYISTLLSIGGTFETYTICPPLKGIQPYNIQYNTTPTPQTLEELDPANWSASNGNDTITAPLAFDRDIYTHWTSKNMQKKDMNFTIDLGSEYSNITRFCYTPAYTTDWPNGYALYTSLDGKEWKCAAQNDAFIMPAFWAGPHPFFKPINGTIELDFPPQTVRYLKLALTKDKDNFFWSIAEIYIYRQKDTQPKNWNIDKLIHRLNEIKPRKIYADQWVSSHLDKQYSPYGKKQAVLDLYIYRHFLIKNGQFNNCAFVVLKENYPSFVKLLGNIKNTAEDFGPYTLVLCHENTSQPEHFYWDGFHLLKCSAQKK